MNKQQLKSRCFHDVEKGCDIENKKFMRGARKEGQPSELLGAFCKTHQINLCRCGWQWGYHYGTSSLKIRKESRGHRLFNQLIKNQEIIPKLKVALTNKLKTCQILKPTKKQEKNMVLLEKVTG